MGTAGNIGMLSRILSSNLTLFLEYILDVPDVLDVINPLRPNLGTARPSLYQAQAQASIEVVFP